LEDFKIKNPSQKSKNCQHHGGTAAPPRDKINLQKTIIRFLNAYSRLQTINNNQLIISKFPLLLHLQNTKINHVRIAKEI
jgi:hypothetical protein